MQFLQEILESFDVLKKLIIHPQQLIDSLIQVQDVEASALGLFEGCYNFYLNCLFVYSKGKIQVFKRSVSEIHMC